MIIHEVSFFLFSKKGFRLYSHSERNARHKKRNQRYDSLCLIISPDNLLLTKRLRVVT